MLVIGFPGMGVLPIRSMVLVAVLVLVIVVSLMGMAMIVHVIVGMGMEMGMLVYVPGSVRMGVLVHVAMLMLVLVLMRLLLIVIMGVHMDVDFIGGHASTGLAHGRLLLGACSENGSPRKPTDSPRKLTPGGPEVNTAQSRK